MGFLNPRGSPVVSLLSCPVSCGAPWLGCRTKGYEEAVHSPPHIERKPIPKDFHLKVEATKQIVDIIIYNYYVSIFEYFFSWFQSVFKDNILIAMQNHHEYNGSIICKLGVFHSYWDVKLPEGIYIYIYPVLQLTWYIHVYIYIYTFYGMYI